MGSRWKEKKLKEAIKQYQSDAKMLAVSDLSEISVNNIDDFIERKITENEIKKKILEEATNDIQRYASENYKKFINYQYYSEYLRFYDEYDDIDNRLYEPKREELKKLRSGMFSSFNKDKIKKLEDEYKAIDESEISPKRSTIWEYHRVLADTVDEGIKHSNVIKNWENKLGCKISLDWVRGDIWGRNKADLLKQYKNRYSKVKVYLAESESALKLYYFDEYLAELRKEKINIEREGRQNRLKAQASENKEQQRNYAVSIRNDRNFQKQLSLYSSCPYCKMEFGSNRLTEAVHLDYIYPVSKGGHSVEENLVFICSDCNKEKSDMTLIRFCKSKGHKYEDVVERLFTLGKDV